MKVVSAFDPAQPELSASKYYMGIFFLSTGRIFPLLDLRTWWRTRSSLQLVRRPSTAQLLPDIVLKIKMKIHNQFFNQCIFSIWRSGSAKIAPTKEEIAMSLSYVFGIAEHPRFQKCSWHKPSFRSWRMRYWDRGDREYRRHKGPRGYRGHRGHLKENQKLKGGSLTDRRTCRDKIASKTDFFLVHPLLWSIFWPFLGEPLAWYYQSSNNAYFPQAQHCD